MNFPSHCFAGRVVIREDALAGLVWNRPCPIPPENQILTQPPMFFCVQHHDAVIDLLWDLFDTQGLIDHDIVAGPPDEFDLLMAQLTEREAPLERGDPDVQNLRGPLP